MDFNIKSQDRAGHDVPIITDDLRCFIQEIEMAFYTEEGQVMNGGSDWIDIRRMVFKKSISADTIKSKIEEVIRNSCYFASFFQFDTDVRFITGTDSDIGYIVVNVYDTDGAKADPLEFLIK